MPRQSSRPARNNTATTSHNNTATTSCCNHSKPRFPAGFPESVEGFEELADACAKQWYRRHQDEPLGPGPRGVLKAIARLTARDDEPSQRYESERIGFKQVLAQKQASAEHLVATQLTFEGLQKDL
ncbi:hypothetical protein GGI21_005948, partial [Coemansia aciculifera]